MIDPPSAEVDRIRDVYQERDRGRPRHPAIRDAYRRLNAERLAKMEALIKTVASPGHGRLLDVGCGAGLDLAHWIAAGWSPDQLAGTDLVAERIERARGACPGVDLRVTDGGSLPFPDSAFDVATVVTVFSSILDPAMRTLLFREMERVVRPGGLVVIYDFVIRKPTNPNVRGVDLATLARSAGRPPVASSRLTPILHLVAAGSFLGARFADLAMRVAPRTHRLSHWRAGSEDLERYAVSPPAVDDGSANPRPARSRTRLLVVTNLYPTADEPVAGSFVARRVDALRERGVDVIVDAARSYRRPSWVRQLELLAGVLQIRGGVDGVEGHVLFPTGLVALCAGRLRRVPVVVYAHGSDVMVTAWRNRLTLELARFVTRHADRVITNSEATALWVARLGAVASVVSPGVDLEWFKPGDRTLTRRSLGLDIDTLLAVYVGHVDERKGADLFAAAIDAVPKWHGAIVGRGPLTTSIAARSPSLSLVGAVPRERVRDWMRAADVIVVPSRREPLGLAAIEALACGTPVIASAVGGLVEVVRDDENGILVPPADVGALAAALGRLLDPDLRARLGAAGPASVARFDLKVASRSMAEVWATLGIST